jgi:undecaprenyl-diphosphatase
MTKTGKRFVTAVGFLAAFAVWTLLVRFVDVQAIGPEGSSVGLAGINQWVHSMTGIHFPLYHITDWLGLVPIGVCMGFGFLGLVQWIKRKSIRKVDRSILLLGGYYLVVMAAYVFFEVFAVNYRPVLIEGILEVSYPSSTTMLVLCVMPTALMQLNQRVKNGILRQCISAAIITFILFMVIGRLVSGVHWVSDIIGGALLSAGLVTLYDAACSLSK